MKILLSPAKLMNLEHQAQWTATKPQFLADSKTVMEVMKQMSSDDLQSLMKISPAIAQANVERNNEWTLKPKKGQAIPAALAFKGEVYRGLDAETLSVEAQAYANQNLFILSGLYGLLRPTDQVMLYRLEMGSKLDIHGSKNLYGFWKEILTDYMNKQLQKDEVILNLASNEYVKVLDKKRLSAPLIDVDFLDYKHGELKKIMVYFKQARGAMARYCAEKQIDALDGVKAFDVDGYRLDENLSQEYKLVFTR